MAKEYKGEAGGTNEGSSIDLRDLSPTDLLAYPDTPEPVSWKKTKYPVSMEEFQSMCLEAQAPDAMSLAASEDTAGDEDEEAVAMEAESESEIGEESLNPEAFTADALAPSKFRNFRSIPDTGWRPPDNTLGVGSNRVVTAVNVDIAGYTKSGTLKFRWPNMTTLFRNVLPPGAGLFDPRVIYDHYERRWLIIVDAKRNSPRGSWIMVAASKSSDPGAGYWVWALNARLNGSTNTNNWADYTTVGIDTQGLYLSNNMFGFTSGFQYSKLRILNKAELYAGGNGPSHSIAWYDFWNIKNPDNSVAFTIQPCMHFRGKGGNPPAYLINALWPGGNKLTMWTLTNPIGHWRGGTAKLKAKSISCRNYSLPPDAIQKGSNTRIETNDSRLLNAIYQVVGGTRRLWTTHTSKLTWSGDSEARSVVQWYEIDVAKRKVRQQNAYGAKGRYYFYPAIQTDIRRNGFIVFGRSGNTEYGSLRYTGRRVSAPKHDLENSRLIKGGESPYLGGRWGDYFGICRDGDNSRRVWMYGEYAAVRGRWGTWVAEAGY